MTNVFNLNNYSDVTRVSWRMKSPATLLISYNLVDTNINLLLRIVGHLRSVYSSHKRPMMRTTFPRYNVGMIVFSVYELHYTRVSARLRDTACFRETHVLYRFFKVSILLCQGEISILDQSDATECGYVTSHSYATVNSAMFSGDEVIFASAMRLR